MDREAANNAHADLASVTGVGLSDALREQESTSAEMADIYDILRERGVDALREYRKHRRQSV